MSSLSNDKINYQSDINEVITTVSSYRIDPDLTNTGQKVDEHNEDEIRRRASNLAERIMSDINNIDHPSKRPEEDDASKSNQQEKQPSNSEVVNENLGSVKKIRKIFDQPNSDSEFQIGSSFNHRKVYYNNPISPRNDSLPRPPPKEVLEEASKITLECTKNVPKSASVIQIRHLFETRNLDSIKSNSNLSINQETTIDCIAPRPPSVIDQTSYEPIHIQSRESLRSPPPPEIYTSPNIKPHVKFNQHIAEQATLPDEHYTARLVTNRYDRDFQPFRSRSLTKINTRSRPRSGSLTLRNSSPKPLEICDCCISPQPLMAVKNSDTSYNRENDPERLEIEPYYNQREMVEEIEEERSRPLPDGVYVRTGQVYEKIDDKVARGPLGHWITTIVNKKKDDYHIPPVTQVTNIWMHNDERPSRDRLILADYDQPCSPIYNRSPYSTGMKNLSASNSPTRSQMNLFSRNGSMPPYRSQHLKSWGSETNCSSSKKMTKSVSHMNRNCCDRLINKSPTPLFHSPEQVERRIRELKSEKTSLVPVPLNELRRRSLNKFPRSNSASPSSEQRLEIKHSVRVNDYSGDYNESGIDCSPISNDFVNKCAYFEDISKVPRIIFLSDKCSCQVHCPSIQPRQDGPKRSASVREFRQNRLPPVASNVRETKRLTQNEPHFSNSELHNYTIQTTWKG